MGVSTNTPIILGIGAFYLIIIGLLGLLSLQAYTSAEPDFATDFGTGGLLSDVFDLATVFFDFLGFFLNFTITALHPVFIIMLIGPLLAAVIYIGVSWARGTA